MKFKSNKTKPQPFPQNLEAAQTLTTKNTLDPVLVNLIGNLKEKKYDKSKKMTMSD